MLRESLVAQPRVVDRRIDDAARGGHRPRPRGQQGVANARPVAHGQVTAADVPGRLAERRGHRHLFPRHRHRATEEERQPCPRRRELRARRVLLTQDAEGLGGQPGSGAVVAGHELGQRQVAHGDGRQGREPMSPAQGQGGREARPGLVQLTQPDQRCGELHEKDGQCRGVGGGVIRELRLLARLGHDSTSLFDRRRDGLGAELGAPEVHAGRLDQAPVATGHDALRPAPQCVRVVREPVRQGDHEPGRRMRVHHLGMGARDGGDVLAVPWVQQHADAVASEESGCLIVRVEPQQPAQGLRRVSPGAVEPDRARHRRGRSYDVDALRRETTPHDLSHQRVHDEPVLGRTGAVLARELPVDEVRRGRRDAGHQ